MDLIISDLNALAANINKCLQAEENLRLKNIQEEKRFKEMISNISHDLRTPLTSIKGYQQLLDKEAVILFQNVVNQAADINTSRIFDRFYTGDRARSHSTGLGLSIVRLLAEQMGGSVNAAIYGDILDIRVSLCLLLVMLHNCPAAFASVSCCSISLH